MMARMSNDKDEQWHYRVVQSEKGKELHRARSGPWLPHKHANEMKRGGMGQFFAWSSTRLDRAF